MPSLTIDLVTFDAESDEVVVYLIEDGPWPEQPQAWKAQLFQIQERIFDAADVVIDGLLQARLPDLEGKRFRIQVDSPSGCPPEVADLLQRAAAFFAEDESYCRAVTESSHVDSLRVVAAAGAPQKPQ